MLFSLGGFMLVLVAIFATKRLVQKRLSMSKQILEPKSSVDEAFVKKCDEDDEP